MFMLLTFNIKTLHPGVFFLLLILQQKNTPEIGVFFDGGDTQNRTEDKGVADPCLTSWLCRHKNW